MDKVSIAPAGHPADPQEHIVRPDRSLSLTFDLTLVLRDDFFILFEPRRGHFLPSSPPGLVVNF